MLPAEQMPLGEAKNRLSEVVDTVEREHARMVITKHGRPAAVLMSIDDLESLEETLDIVTDAQLMSDLREAEADRAAGRIEVLTKEEALRAFAEPDPE